MKDWLLPSKKLLVVFLSALFVLQLPGFFVRAASNCDGVTPDTKIWWDGIELKTGQIGRLTVKQNTPLYRLDSENKIYSGTLKAGEKYRIYAFKPGKLSVGGGLYVHRDVRIHYETPSAAKKTILACKAQAIGRTITLYETKASIESKLGKEKRATLNEYGLTWAAYHSNYRNFYMVSYMNQFANGIYTNAPEFYVKGIHAGSTRKEVAGAFGKPVRGIIKGNTYYFIENNSEVETFLNGGRYIIVFYDIHNGGRVTSLLVLTEKMENLKHDYYGVPSSTLQSGFELQMLDMTNAVRVKHRLKPLLWEEKARTSSRLHSLDMANHSYFEHTNLKGLSPFERMQAAGLSFIYAGENIAMGFQNSIQAHEALMNSLGHRKNILNSSYTHIGIGIQFQKASRTPYYTQNFLTPQ